MKSVRGYNTSGCRNILKEVSRDNIPFLLRDKFRYPEIKTNIILFQYNGKPSSIPAVTKRKKIDFCCFSDGREKKKLSNFETWHKKSNSLKHFIFVHGFFQLFSRLFLYDFVVRILITPVNCKKSSL